MNSESGTILGTPAAAGISSFAVKAVDLMGSSQTTQSFNLEVDSGSGALSVCNTSLPNYSVNELYDAQLAASGAIAGTTWSIKSGSLPAGLSLDPDGDVSGTPTSSDPATFTVKVKDADSDVATAEFTIANQAVANPVIQSFTSSVVGETVTFNLQVTDSNSVGLWSGSINFQCDDPQSGAPTGSVGFVWFANPEAGGPFGVSGSSSLLSGTLNDGEYNPDNDVYTDTSPDGQVYGSCLPYVDVNDQDGGSSTIANGASFSIPQL